MEKSRPESIGTRLYFSASLRTYRIFITPYTTHDFYSPGPKWWLLSCVLTTHLLQFQSYFYPLMLWSEQDSNDENAIYCDRILRDWTLSMMDPTLYFPKWNTCILSEKQHQWSLPQRELNSAVSLPNKTSDDIAQRSVSWHLLAQALPQHQHFFPAWSYKENTDTLGLLQSCYTKTRPSIILRRCDTAHLN